MSLDLSGIQIGNFVCMHLSSAVFCFTKDVYKIEQADPNIFEGAAAEVVVLLFAEMGSMTRMLIELQFSSRFLPQIGSSPLQMCSLGASFFNP